MIFRYWFDSRTVFTTPTFLNLLTTQSWIKKILLWSFFFNLWTHPQTVVVNVCSENKNTDGLRYLFPTPFTNFHFSRLTLLVSPKLFEVLETPLIFSKRARKTPLWTFPGFRSWDRLEVRDTYDFYFKSSLQTRRN